MSQETNTPTLGTTATVPNGTCGSCTMANGENAKYCGGCGQSLTENCENCAKPVYLTQTYCGDCGANLKELVEIRKQKLSDLLADAKKAASEYRYVEARQILNRITAISDYRFKRISDVANRTLNKVIDIEGKTETTVAEACKRARIANEAGNNSEVIRCLEKIPDHLLDDEFRHLLRTTQSQSSQQTELEAELKREINNKNWEIMGGLVQQLLELNPSHESAKRLAKKITQRLLDSSKRSSKQGHYERALEKLKCIPDCQKTETIEEALSNAATDQWIWGELNSEPFASATLERLASRLCDTYPESQLLNDVKKKLQQSLAAKKQVNRSQLNRWKGPNQSWMGGEANRLSRPENIRYQNSCGFEKHPGIFSVAIGLALQGVGRSRVEEDFLIRKKGLFSSGKKKSDIAWGLDVGTGSVKAVRLHAENGQITLTNSFYTQIEGSVTRGKDPSEERKRLAPIIKEFLDSHHSDDEPIWVNFNGSHAVNRFVRLPPVKTKDALNLLDREIESKIPIAIEELVVAKWICPGKRLPTMGRPAMAATARKEVITRRMTLLESLGLKLAGLQSDTIALTNFVDHEFSGMWPSIEGLKDENLDSIQDQLSNSICLIDAGASTTHLILVSAEAHWSWSIETGGDDITLQLASSAKVNRADAEKIKFAPNQLPRVAEQYLPIESSLDTLRSRISTMYNDAMKQENPFRPNSSWCVGGACQTYQWMRRIMVGK